ncbi:MAG TPA: LCP family protein [Dermatophilaceae bacterium]|nr:LCP family protein [Dermatophilaceae bacterium]
MQSDTPTPTRPAAEPSEGLGDDRAAPRRRWVRRAIISVVALAVALAVALVTAVGGYLFYLNRTVDQNVRHADLLPAAGANGSAGAGQPAPTPQTAAELESMNVLLVGSDELPGETRARSDVIIVAHLDADRNSVTLVHFPRDLYVEIPGRSGRDRINAAYRYGGVPLLAATIRSLTGLQVDHAAQVDFERFTAMTDAVGGVDVRVEEASPGFPVGSQGMNGDEALRFVQERKMLSQGDISRGRREQAFIKALLLKALSRDVLGNPVRFASFVDAATKNLTVDNNFSVADLRTEALRMRNLRSDDIRFITAPQGRFFTTAGGAMVIDPDRAGMSALGKALREDRMQGYRR